MSEMFTRWIWPTMRDDCWQSTTSAARLGTGRRAAQLRIYLDERALTGASTLAHPLPLLRFASFLSDGRILVCGGGTGQPAAPQLGCRVHGDFFSDSVPGPLLPSTSEGNAYYNLGASVAPDGLSVTLVRTTGDAEWLELQPDGRRRSVEIPNAKIGAVAALGGARFAAGLSDGRIVVIDADTGDVSREFDTERDEISAIVRMDGERLAVGVNNRIVLENLGDAQTFQTSEEEILILSQDDLSILRRLSPSPLGGRINRLVASDDGRRLVSAARPAGEPVVLFGVHKTVSTYPWYFTTDYPDLVEVWDTATWQGTLLSGGRNLSIERVQFGATDKSLLVSGLVHGVLWNLEQRQMEGPFSGAAATLSGETVHFLDLRSSGGPRELVRRQTGSLVGRYVEMTPTGRSAAGHDNK